MHIYPSPTRHGWWTAKINWSRELTFSGRQVGFILRAVPNERGVYCIYAKCCTWSYQVKGVSRGRRSAVVYIGSGKLGDRLRSHLVEKRNPDLTKLLSEHDLAYRYERIFDKNPDADWPRQVEATFLRDFEDEFGELPPANHKREVFKPVEGLKRFYYEETGTFSILQRR